MEPKYDVAISFLSADENIAAGLYDRLSSGLEIFFYPRKQEALAGTNGMESMREPFYDQSRVVVVLYREPWGTTPWTRVEQTAITDRCLQLLGWQGLFFMMLDDGNPPRWLPPTHVRFNYTHFGLEEAVGAIKARVLEMGGVITPLTALKRATLAKQETEDLKERELLNSPQSTESSENKRYNCSRQSRNSRTVSIPAAWQRSTSNQIHTSSICGTIA